MYLSRDKRQFVWQVLGTTAADRYECRLFVPADKKAYIAAMLKLGTYTNRQLASMAGMLISISAAVSMTHLYTKELCQSMQGDMNSTADYLALAREDLQYWSDCIEMWGGKSWMKRSAKVNGYIYMCL